LDLVIHNFILFKDEQSESIKEAVMVVIIW
jgi:hypothetical protein